MAVLTSLFEVLCVLLIAAGLWLWICPGAALVAAGTGGLALSYMAASR